MANTNAPFGFLPLGHMDGNAPNFALTTFTVQSSDTNTYSHGDLVGLSTATGFIGGIGTMSSASVVPALGVFWDCQYYSAAVGRTVWDRKFPGSVGSSAPGQARVITDPEQLFICQVSSGPVTAASIGAVFEISTVTAANTLTGASGMALESSAVAQGAAAVYSSGANAWPPFKLVNTLSGYSSLNAAVNGGDDTTNFNIVVVKANAWTRSVLIGLST